MDRVDAAIAALVGLSAEVLREVLRGGRDELES